MRNLLAVAVFGFTMVATPAFAGSGHSHDPISKEQASALAVKKRDQLVTAGKLDKSWSGVAVSKVEQKTFDKKAEWVVTFENKAAANPAQRTLYMFYAIDGHYLATNFTGK
ncbi:MAG: DUF6488 family protein [Gammaproteobacteria bacterium]|nr:DUF6488 family protein [Gammaproteobacteria bacterium]